MNRNTNNSFNLFIKHDKTYVLQITKNIKIIELRKLISDKIKIPTDIFYLVFGGRILDNMSLLLNNPTIEQINNYEDSSLPFIGADSTLYLKLHTHGIPFIKKLYYFIEENGYNLESVEHKDIYGLELDRVSLTICKNWKPN